MHKMITLFTVLCAGVLLFTMPPEVEAKRMSSGQTVGKQYSVPSKTDAAPSVAPQRVPQTPGATPSQSGASRWLGPLAGLAAGGLLAAMLFGDGFQGLQIMDVLMVGLLIVGGILLFKMLRGRSPQPATAPGAFGGGPVASSSEPMSAPMDRSDVAHPRSVWNTLGGQQGASAVGGSSAPGWFSAQSFTEGSKTHFMRMQAAWDRGDLRDIAEYTTPELYAALQAERLRTGTEDSFTEVVQLNAELLGTQRDGEHLVASIRFSGLIREERGAAPEAFSEIWHVIHDWEQAGGDWYVAGIQQVTD